MCEVAEALKTEGRQKGRREGIIKGKVEILLEMDFSVAEIAERLNISVDEVENIAAEV